LDQTSPLPGPQKLFLPDKIGATSKSIDIALEVWLEEHFAETARDIETEFQAPENTLQIPEIIHVTSKHPIYHF
jgi:hypothetical protein